MTHEDLVAREQAARPTEVFNIQFTSGTTGPRKGDAHASECADERVLYRGAGPLRTRGPGLRPCAVLPLLWLCLRDLGVRVYGSALVVPAPSFDPRLTLAAIDSEHCTSIYGVPTMFVAELGHPERPNFDLSSLRTGIMAGSPCPLPLMEAVIHTMGAKQITIGYGQTEASPIITQTSVDDPIEVRVGTVGRPIPGVEVQLVDPVTRQEVGEGKRESFRVRGHGVMAGYYKAPEATARVIDAAGWLYTGDLALRRPRWQLPDRGPLQGTDHSRGREYLSARDRRVPPSSSGDR